MTARKSNTNENRSYFNILARGFGYINEVKFSKNKNPRVSVVLLYGDSSKPKKEYYSLSLDTEISLYPFTAIRSFAGYINDENHKVSAIIELSRAGASAFTFENGKNAGKQGITNFGSLLSFEKVMINGEVCYLSENQQNKESV